MCEKIKKKYKPLEDKRKICIVSLKGGSIKIMGASQLLDLVRHSLTQIMSIHFFGPNTMIYSAEMPFTYYMFALKLDEEKVQVPKNPQVQVPFQKMGKGAGLNHLIRGFGLDKDEYDYHLIQVIQSPNGEIESNLLIIHGYSMRCLG